MDSLKSRLKKTFLELININSYYPNDLAVRDYVVAWCESHEVSCVVDDFGNVIAALPGQDDVAPVMLNTHLDIPEDTPQVHYRETSRGIEGTGTTILGADPKTGLAVLLELMRDLAKEDPASRASVEFVFTRGEEQGLLGANGLDITKVRARYGLVIDQDGPATEVVTKAPGSIKFSGTFKGKTVHTREPEQGINALQLAVNAIGQTPLGHTDDSKKVTWNVGLVNGGTAVNSVPGSVEFAAEFRSYDGELLHAEARRVHDIFAKAATEAGGQLEADRQTMYEPYALPANDPLLARLDESYQRHTMKPSYLETFGASDANIFNARGIHCAAIGSGYYYAHQYREIADLGDMQDLVAFLHAFVQNTTDDKTLTSATPKARRHVFTRNFKRLKRTLRPSR